MKTRTRPENKRCDPETAHEAALGALPIVMCPRCKTVFAPLDTLGGHCPDCQWQPTGSNGWFRYQVKTA